MDMSFSDADRTFQQEVRDWLADCVAGGSAQTPGAQRARTALERRSRALAEGAGGEGAGPRSIGRRNTAAPVSRRRRTTSSISNARASARRP